MRNIVLVGLMAAISVPAAASAQSREIRKDERNVDRQNEQLQRAVDSGDARAIEHRAHDARKAGQELREDRDHFARNKYVAPYRGWSYAAVSPGATLRSRFYGESYTVAHPEGYQLTRAKRNQRWVRYGDDLVLVNLRTGRVVDVATGRF